jgi:glyoxylase-like metal-dependent hydrolase (beta-lactamase superfamily II)
LKCIGGYLLIDTDYPKHYRLFERKLANLGIAISDIKYLLLTHHHDDHAGFAAELVRSTGCQVIAHRNAVSALEEGKSEETIKPVNRRIKIVFTLYTKELVLTGSSCIRLVIQEILFQFCFLMEAPLLAMLR